METDQQQESPKRGSVAAGFFLTLGVYAAFALVAWGIGRVLRVEEELFLMALVLPGLVQLVVGVPLWIVLRRRGEPAMCRGVILAAVVVFLLNAGCWGLVSMSFRH